MTGNLREMPVDIHVHVQPWEMMHPAALETIRRGRPDYPLIEAIMKSPAALVEHLDAIQVGRVGLINYVAPDIMGFTSEVNAWVSRYRDHAPERMLAFGGIHPPACADVREEMKRLTEDLRLDALKIHPPHQDLDPAGYRSGSCPELAVVYEVLQERGVPLMVHTGTSIFPGARSRLGDPMRIDDVAVDFPELRIIMAHGGRPLWMEAAFFLLRRHPNVYMDVSGIPPQHLLNYFPRLEYVSQKVLFGTDWPSPGVPGIAENLDAIEGLPLSEEALHAITHANAYKVFPRV